MRIMKNDELDEAIFIGLVIFFIVYLIKILV